MSDPLLTTGRAAEILGCTRQHVVDLTERGELPVAWVGRHRRIPQEAVLRFAGARSARRVDERSRAIGVLTAAELLTRPDEALEQGGENLERLQQRHQGQGIERYLTEWQALITNRDLPGIVEILTSMSPHAVQMRSCTPLAGIVPDTRRQSALRNV